MTDTERIAQLTPKMLAWIRRDVTQCKTCNGKGRVECYRDADEDCLECRSKRLLLTLLDSSEKAIAELREQLAGMAITINDLYPWADRNPEELEGKEVSEHKELKIRAMNLLKDFDRQQNGEPSQLQRERALSDQLAAALKQARCACCAEWQDECPTCGCKLFKVRNDPNGMLNDKQFDSVRAGDFYCRTCKGTEGNTRHKYFWKRELQEKREQCTRCAALAQHAALREAEPQSPA